MPMAVLRIISISRRGDILIVDDEKMVTSSLSAFLEWETEHRILTFQSPVEAIETIRDHPIDLVIADFLMPEMNGWEVLSKLATMNLDIPVIILTAKIQTIDKVIGRNNSLVREYITKPFNNEYLLEKIKNIVNE